MTYKQIGGVRKAPDRTNGKDVLDRRGEARIRSDEARSVEPRTWHRSTAVPASPQKGHTTLLAVRRLVNNVHTGRATAWHRRVGFQECGFIAGHPFDDGLGELFFAKRLD